MKETVDKILSHYGVKGMKWGVRRSKVPKMGPSDDAKNAHRAYIKSQRSGVIALSNKELKALNSRLDLEKRYSELVAKPSLLERGLSHVTTIVTVGKSYDEVAKLTGRKQIKDMLSKEALAKKAAASAAKKTTKKVGGPMMGG